MVKRELKSLLPAWLFFYSAFSLVNLTLTVVLHEHRMVAAASPSKIFVGTLIIAKGLLLADLIPFLRKLDRQPILTAALSKTAAYAVILFFLQFLESLFDFRHLGLRGASQEFVRGLATPRFWLIQLWLLVLLLAYSLTREFYRRLGRQRFRELFLGR